MNATTDRKRCAYSESHKSTIKDKIQHSFPTGTPFTITKQCNTIYNNANPYFWNTDSPSIITEAKFDTKYLRVNILKNVLILIFYKENYIF
jgi:hypothetical protein